MGNSVEISGGGLHSCGGRIENNTIANNTAAGEGGGLYSCDGTIVNCIDWGNTARSGEQFYDSSGPTYSCIQGWGGSGEGNIAGNPFLVDPASDNYRLSPSSPCIDTGRNADWMLEAVDLEGNPRIFHGEWSRTVDMGAYEYGSWPFRVIKVVRRELPGGGTELTWKSRPADTYIIWSGRDLSAEDPWTTKEATVPSGGETTSWADGDASSPCKFYKIEVE